MLNGTYFIETKPEKMNKRNDGKYHADYLYPIPLRLRRILLLLWLLWLMRFNSRIIFNGVAYGIRCIPDSVSHDGSNDDVAEMVVPIRDAVQRNHKSNEESDSDGAHFYGGIVKGDSEKGFVFGC